MEIDGEVERVREIYVDAWEKTWGHVRVSDDEFDSIAQGLKHLIDPGLCFVA